ncbi:MAG: VanZ family protein [Bacteroidota bacterium]
MIKHYWPVLSWAAFIVLLTLLPGSLLPTAPSSWTKLPLDKLVHAVLFFVFTFLLFQSFKRQYSSTFLRSYTILAGIIIGIVFGIITESLQSIINAGRSAELYDILADAVGVIAAWPAFIALKRKMN